MTQLPAEELAGWGEEGRAFFLLDVRHPEEKILADMGGELIPLQELEQRWREIPTDLPIVVYCHHGVRSLRACAFLEAQGLRDLHNLRGGIDAWSMLVDPAVPRY
jgi:rhodanese-related sulfurtransferase